MRLIDADALKEEVSSLRMVITGLRCGKGVLSEYAREHLKSILRIIDESPTIDAEPVRHGRWICPDFDFSDYWKCSACNEEFYFEQDQWKIFHCCPNCGARMDAKED